MRRTREEFFERDRGIFMSEWISVEDRLPDESVSVLVKQAYCDEIMIAFLRSEFWIEQCENESVNGDAWVDTTICRLSSPEYDRITHWMPLPEPPESE